VSTHLDHLAGDIFRIEEALSTLLNQQTGAEGLPITTLQSLDFTRQSLEDCALLLDMMAKNRHRPEQAELCSLQKDKLRLESTRKLIKGATLQQKPPENGDVDLF
jgi:hypothetical protein